MVIVKESGQSKTVSFRVRESVSEAMESLPRGMKTKILTELVENWYNNFPENLLEEATRLENKAKKLREIAERIESEREFTYENAKREIIEIISKFKLEARKRFVDSPVGKGIISKYPITIEQVNTWIKEFEEGEY